MQKQYEINEFVNPKGFGYFFYFSHQCKYILLFNRLDKNKKNNVFNLKDEIHTQQNEECKNNTLGRNFNFMGDLSHTIPSIVSTD